MTVTIRTTHVGSMPRSQALADILLKLERLEEVPAAERDGVIGGAVDQVVGRQVAAGIDIVSDGEQSKASYSTYIVDRLTGFGGDNQRKVALDLAPYPEFREKMSRMTGTQAFRRSSCIGPITVKDMAPLQRDIANFQAAIAHHQPWKAFMNSASPGLITAFQPNAYYKTHEEYVWALGEAMRPEYQAIIDAGLMIQLDCPDLAMAHHTGFQDLSEAEFIKRAELHVEVLNAALEGIPADKLRMHICWGNYEGPHDHDIPVEKIMHVILSAKPSHISVEGANARHAHEWKAWQQAKIPEDKVLMPGMIETTSNYIEHPELIAQRIEQWANIVGSDRVIASTDCGMGTFAGFGKLDGEIGYRKLESLAEGAAIASKRLS